VPSLDACLQAIDAACVTPLSFSSTAYLMYDLGKRVDMDKAKLSSSDRNEVVNRAEKMVHMLLGFSSSISKLPPSTRSAAATAAPVQQLNSARLSQLSWALSALVGFEQRVMSTDARQLCYALAERAAQPGVMESKADMACRSWAGVLYGLSRPGVKCSDDSRVQQAFTAAIEQQLPSLHLAKQRCIAQDLSMTAVACRNAGFEGDNAAFYLSGGRQGGRSQHGWGGWGHHGKGLPTGLGKPY